MNTTTAKLFATLDAGQKVFIERFTKDRLIEKFVAHGRDPKDYAFTAKETAPVFAVEKVKP